MENSNIKAKQLFISKDINKNKLINLNYLKDLKDFIDINNINFGDIIYVELTNEYPSIYIIGKNGKLIENYDYTKLGPYLGIPYSITEYLQNAVYKYSDIETFGMALRFDDKIILDNINTKNCKILQNWNWKIYLWNWSDDMHIRVGIKKIDLEEAIHINNKNFIRIVFPNKNENIFDVEKTNIHIIKKWYESSQLEQDELNFEIEIKNNKKLYDAFFKIKDTLPNIYCTWSIYCTKLNYYENSNANYIYKSFKMKGPIKDKNKTKKSINTFFKKFKIIYFNPRF